MAAIDPLIVSEWAHIEKTLTALHITLDHPVERPTLKELAYSLGHHAGGMKLFRYESGCALFSQPEINPGREIFDAIASNAKFDEIESHGTDLAKLVTGFKP